jgi:subtilisin family serine protease
MPLLNVLLEFESPQPEAFGVFSAAIESEEEAAGQAKALLGSVAELGVVVDETHPPVPMFTPENERPMTMFADFATAETHDDIPSATSIVAAAVPEDSLGSLLEHSGVTVWQNSELTLLGASSSVDCMPFQPASTIADIEARLGVQEVWDEGHRGEGIVVGIIDEGVNGLTYPVRGGYEGLNAPAPGSAPVSSHGSMCAADVLIAAPEAVIYDYHFLDVPRSGGALAMFQAVLDRRRLDGTPHLTNNSYGFRGVPPQDKFPGHEIWNSQHPLHRKIREVVASGAPAFFSAGNCGADCPAPGCDISSIGPGKSIHASNSLAEVITVAAVNGHRTRVGYSAQGPGMFEKRKPDFAAYSHIFANFGPGRPGGDNPPINFDSGTSAASPVACGVAALLLSAQPKTTPGELKAALVAGVEDSPAGGWDADFGAGVIHAGAAYRAL